MLVANFGAGCNKLGFCRSSSISMFDKKTAINSVTKIYITCCGFNMRKITPKNLIELMMMTRCYLILTIRWLVGITQLSEFRVTQPRMFEEFTDWTALFTVDHADPITVDDASDHVEGRAYKRLPVEIAKFDISRSELLPWHVYKSLLWERTNAIHAASFRKVLFALLGQERGLESRQFMTVPLAGVDLIEVDWPTSTYENTGDHPVARTKLSTELLLHDKEKMLVRV
ncbi:hypothetical protein RF11_07179 [Thelohanellus kitauei]|uniref:Uncharacterized protein n=1 Tax=Thelohanellus kitauei TaxID=669202 RepID=A0A0C2N3K9_THEKT|nr:hypothetical protein RF11_07179 [Thelohanellus kitauei]